MPQFQKLSRGICQLNIHIKFQQDRIINEGARSKKLKSEMSSKDNEELEEALSRFILGIFRTVIKIEPN